MFVGRHERQLDLKGRLALPAAFRPRFEPSCFLTLGADGCIDVFTRDEFDAMAKETTEKMKRGEITRDEWRALAHNTFEGAVDGQGRVNLERDLRDYATIEPGAKVIVAGSYDRVELWNPTAYEARRSRGTAAIRGS